MYSIKLLNPNEICICICIQPWLKTRIILVFGQFSLRTITVYDNNSTASVKLWDEKANLPGLEELKPGDLIKIIKAYVKSDLTGAPTINIGSGATIETSESESDIVSIDSKIS